VSEEVPACFLCGRPLGSKVQWHHVVPKSRGGRETAPVHPICHKTIHATLSNKEIERSYASADALRAHPQVARFIAWMRDKDADFHAPTRKKR
jgi:5-methylcytosine-specific restriction endonuclease McrA